MSSLSPVVRDDCLTCTRDAIIRISFARGMCVPLSDAGLASAPANAPSSWLTAFLRRCYIARIDYLSGSHWYIEQATDLLRPPLAFPSSPKASGGSTTRRGTSTWGPKSQWQKYSPILDWPDHTPEMPSGSLKRKRIQTPLGSQEPSLYIWPCWKISESVSAVVFKCQIGWGGVIKSHLWQIIDPPLRTLPDYICRPVEQLS